MIVGQLAFAPIDPPPVHDFGLAFDLRHIAESADKDGSGLHPLSPSIHRSPSAHNSPLGVSNQAVRWPPVVVLVPMAVAVVIAFAFSNLRWVVGPCLRKLAYMSHVV